METERNYILMDVGGTSVTCNIANQSGQLLLKESLNFPSGAKESRDSIFDRFANMITETARKTEVFPSPAPGTMAGAPALPASGGMNRIHPVWGVGMAFPGPFDYEKGISLMQGLDKYDAIYGLPIAGELKKRIDWLLDVPFLFLHDIEAFAVGESWFGEVKNTGRFICLCIGTGTGSAFVENRRILKKEESGVPLHGWLYGTPFKESMIDDYLSVRGLAALSEKICGVKLTGLELWKQVNQEDTECKTNFPVVGAAQSHARRCFEEFGSDLEAAIVPYLDRFQPEAVVMGGQISKSFSLFGGAFETACIQRGIRVYLEPETSIRAMQGLYVRMERGDTYVES